MIFKKKALEVQTIIRPDLRDFTPEEMDLYHSVQQYTMTSPERIKALKDAVLYIIENDIKGDLVECGVWKGGSILAIIKTLLQKKITNRKIHLFDTFEGMTEPTSIDVDPNGNQATTRMEQEANKKDESWMWAIAPIQEVKSIIAKEQYPEKNIHFIKGKVEDTLKEHKPPSIALLRLDTDWYESTKIELEELYDSVIPGGVIIIDDYGHWAGCKKAVDEFIKERNLKIFLNRVDYTGRLIIKP